LLIRYYVLSSKLFILSGLLFFKFLLRLLIFNTFLYFIFNLNSNRIVNASKYVNKIVVVTNDLNLNGINETQTNKIINLLQKHDMDLKYSLSVFDPLSNSLGVLIPQSNKKVFLNFINHVDFKKWRPIQTIQYVSKNPLGNNINGKIGLINSNNELIDLETSKENFLSIGENWFSNNHLSIYLLILILFLLVIDASLKFQILK